MRKRAGCLLLLFVILLSGCADGKDGSSNISIKPYSLSEKEQVLINKTGVDAIQFFRLDGTLAEVEDLQFSMEVYKDGKLTEDHVYARGQVEKEFNQTILSYGFDRKDNQVIFLNGFDNGLSEMTEELGEIDMSSFTSFLNEKKKLVKDESMYLTAWIGTSENEMGRTVALKEDGTLSDEIVGAEAAYVFKVTLTDYGKE
ncbi:hypothetical protein [Bacillus sp. SG-1]|uniref:hypothetical protein n=1 Tax=Bacillus sp. SG-1 TaxID=161544 RepID=UPI0001544F16|nr:hypothetical protein [Bacillus sp. SG-1]EDL64191.1 hypothetical protein BSG1_19844 [Bacillus sp. SG-1]